VSTRADMQVANLTSGIADTSGPTYEGQPFRLTRRQRRIVERFRLLGPGPASMFEDACRIHFQDLGLVNQTHLAAHLVREANSSLRQVSGTLIEKDDDPRWGLPDLSRIVQRIRSCFQVDSTEMAGGAKASVERAAVALGIPPDDPVVRQWHKDVTQPLHTWAHRSGQWEARPADDSFRELWARTEAVFDVALDRFEAKITEFHRLLDAIRQTSNPSRKHARELKKLPLNPVSMARFFDQLDDPRWLVPLRKEGLFERSLPAWRDEDGRLVAPPWPPGEYLARMADHNPDEVARAIKGVRATSNTAVHEALAKAVSKLPARHAAPLVTLAMTWLNGPFPSPRLHEAFGELVTVLADGGEKQAGLVLAKELLALGDDGGVQ